MHHGVLAPNSDGSAPSNMNVNAGEILSAGCSCVEGTMVHRVAEGKTTVRSEAQCRVQLASMVRSRSCVREPQGPSLTGDGRGVITTDAGADTSENAPGDSGDGNGVRNVGEGSEGNGSVNGEPSPSDNEGNVGASEIVVDGNSILMSGGVSRGGSEGGGVGGGG